MNIQSEYNRLNNPPSDVDVAWKRKRGYDFEKLIYELLGESDLMPRTSYKSSGEQIDGSFVYGEKVFLLEAKWHKKEMPASQIYEFKGKVDGKLVLDLGKEEDNYGEADLPVAITQDGDITLIQMDGNLTQVEFKEAMEMVKVGCKQILDIQREALKNKFSQFDSEELKEDLMTGDETEVEAEVETEEETEAEVETEVEAEDEAEEEVEEVEKKVVEDDEDDDEPEENTDDEDVEEGETNE